MIVTREATILHSVSGKRQTMLLDESGKHVVFEVTQGDSQNKGHVAYTGYDPVLDVFVENVDFGADGTLDFRSTEKSGRVVKREYRVGEHWLEMVQRDGLSGVIFEGRFMSVADAIKLGERVATNK